MISIDLSPVRAQFPALMIKENDRPAVFFDGAGGTQVPQRVLDAVTHYQIYTNANHGGPFRTSRESDAISQAAHEGMADFLNASMVEEIAFGHNMTSLTFAISRSIGQMFGPGDEIIITGLDHDANRMPWLALAEKGVVIREVDFNPTDCTLRLDQLESYLNHKTRLVAVVYASNAVGTINPITQIAKMAHAVNAWVWVDGVAYAPHGPIDVQSLGCDFLALSPYKFFAPHSGVVWGRYNLLQELPAFKVRSANNLPPSKFETGTANYEAQAGVLAAIEYIAELGAVYGASFADDFPNFSGRRLAVKQGMASIRAYERILFEHFARGLLSIPGLTFYGISDPARFDQRTSTAAFRLAKRSPMEVAEYLGRRGIYAWAGNFYALATTEGLGVDETGGVVRANLTHYNTLEEVDYFLKCLQEIP